MKIRNGFVSNSSASSFIILLNILTDKQKQMIYNHIQIGQSVDKIRKDEGLAPLYEYYEDWNVKEDDFSLWCSTSMDNFDLMLFAVREANISEKDMILLGNGLYFYDLYEDPEYFGMKRSNKLKRLMDKMNEQKTT